ncbi:metallopeptidase family protein [Micrococcales bacterium 31B]|nr:metallopeptidase family protein [Micrococcales bacterium 31B]
MTDEDFDAAVADALDQVPDEFHSAFDNLVIFVEDEAPDGEDILGVFDGLSLIEAAEGPSFEPNRITIFKNNILDICEDDDEVRHEVFVTVMHELGHYFGMDEERLHELGWE